MKSHLASKHPRPDAYDEFWRLLPVFIAFLFFLLIFADVPNGPSLPLSSGAQAAPAPFAPTSGDPSVPPAESVMGDGAVQPSEPVATF
jgi:hypothetical protein